MNMDVQPRAVHVYVNRSGASPVEQWLDSLRDRTARARVVAGIDRLRLGNLGQTRSLGGALCELKIAYGPGYRVYFAHAGPVLILLLCGGDKSTQVSDIFRARQFWQDYRLRFRHREGP